MRAAGSAPVDRAEAVLAEQRVEDAHGVAHLAAGRAAGEARVAPVAEVAHADRVLSMHENARFEGCSRPEDAPPEARSSINAESSNPPLRLQPLSAFDQKRKISGAPNEEAKQSAGGGVQVFAAACVAIIAIGIVSHFALNTLQQPTGLAYASDAVHIDLSWIERSKQQ